MGIRRFLQMNHPVFGKSFILKVRQMMKN